jgi:hypothetical protein
MQQGCLKFEASQAPACLGWLCSELLGDSRSHRRVALWLVLAARGAFLVCALATLPVLMQPLRHSAAALRRPHQSYRLLQASRTPPPRGCRALCWSPAISSSACILTRLLLPQAAELQGREFYVVTYATLTAAYLAAVLVGPSLGLLVALACSCSQLQEQLPHPCNVGPPSPPTAGALSLEAAAAAGRYCGRGNRPPPARLLGPQPGALAAAQRQGGGGGAAAPRSGCAGGRRPCRRLFALTCTSSPHNAQDLPFSPASSCHLCRVTA